MNHTKQQGKISFFALLSLIPAMICANGALILFALWYTKESCAEPINALYPGAFCQGRDFLLNFGLISFFGILTIYLLLGFLSHIKTKPKE